MFNPQEEKDKWLPYIGGMVATALLSTLATELVRWAVDELKERVSSNNNSKETK